MTTYGLSCLSVSIPVAFWHQVGNPHVIVAKQWKLFYCYFYCYCYYSCCCLYSLAFPLLILTPLGLIFRLFPTMVASWGLRFLFVALGPPPPQRHSVLCVAHQGFGNTFPVLTGLRPWGVGRPLVLLSLFTLRAASLWHFALSSIAPFVLPSQLRTPLGLYHLTLGHQASRGPVLPPRNLPPMELGRFRELSSPLGIPRTAPSACS
jgi:hypothetical protein